MQTDNPKKNQHENKIANSGVRILELLKALATSELNTQEILQLFENKSHKIYRKEVVTKYINTLKLVGINEDVIYKETKLLLSDTSVYDKMSKANNPYGDGFASKRIVDAIINKYSSKK